MLKLFEFKDHRMMNVRCNLIVPPLLDTYILYA